MAYSKIEFYGGCDLNYIWCKEGVITGAQITTIKNNGVYSPIWDKDTYALATFKNNISATEFSGFNIVGYKISRENLKDGSVRIVANLSNAETRIQDYNIRNRTPYQYNIIPIINENGTTKIGSPIVTDTIDTYWSCISIIGLNPTNNKNEYKADTKNIWTFSLNITTEGMSPSYNKEFTDGFGRFPKGYSGDKNYIESGVKSMIGEVDNYAKYIDDDIIKLDKWRQFCNNGQLKLLKDRKGHIIPCDIKDTSLTCLDETVEQATEVSFNFVELCDYKDITVYGLEVN